jgi:glycosyltransferase involved in cell wall biosynthesis
MKINFFQGNKVRSGGNIYDDYVYKILKSNHNICYHKSFTNYRLIGHTYLDLIYSAFFNKSNQGEIDIMDYFTSTGFLHRLKGKRIIIFHHFDEHENNKPKKYNYLFKRFLKNAKNATVVVVSKYWYNFLKEKGVEDIQLIYNSFKNELYKPSLIQSEFLSKYNLENKPIIYIGKNSISKSLNAYQIIQHLNAKYHIITTGINQEFEGPLNLNLNFSDYVNLLHYSSCTLLLTDFKEGWSRIAHESLLCGTPVIGNGSGGMLELLKVTNQIIVDTKDKTKINQIVNKLILENKRVSENEIMNINIYDRNYFNEQWNNLIFRIK